MGVDDIWSNKDWGLGGDGKRGCVKDGRFSSAKTWRLTPSAGKRCLKRGFSSKCRDLKCPIFSYSSQGNGGGGLNRPFPNCLLIEFWCTAFHMEMSFTRTFIVMQIKPISIQRLCTRTRFETGAEGNLEMSYWVYGIFTLNYVFDLNYNKVYKMKWLWSPKKFFVPCFCWLFWPWPCTKQNRFWESSIWPIFRLVKQVFYRARARSSPGGAVLPYVAYTGTCRWTGYSFWPLCPEQGI